MKVYVIQNEQTGKYYHTKYSFGSFTGAKIWTKKNTASWVRNYHFKHLKYMVVKELSIKTDIREIYPFQIFIV